MYDKKKNLIVGYNDAFISAFNIDKEKFDGKVFSRSMNSEEIFKEIELFDESTQEKLNEGSSESEFNCYLWLKKYRLKKVIEKPSYIRICVLEDHNNTMIIRLKEGHRAKTTLSTGPRYVSTQYGKEP